MPSTIRSFIAIKLPAPIAGFACNVADTLKAQGINARWVKSKNIHLTVKFLGDVPIDDIERINHAVSQAVGSISPMTLFLRGVGVFPGIKRARVIWTGLGGDTDRILQLHQQIDERLYELGFPKEKKRFRAHLTLGRFKRPNDPECLLASLKKTSDVRSDPFLCDSIVHMKSDLQKQGPVYTPLEVFQLTEIDPGRR